MQRPNPDLEKEFNAGGIYFLDAKSIHDPTFEGSYLGVEVEIAVPEGTTVSCPDFSFSVINRRGVAIFMTDWRIYRCERSGQSRLHFLAMIRIPAGPVARTDSRGLAMTFMDLCFYAGNEAIPAERPVDTFTEQRAQTQLCDLGWVLPSRYVDTTIDALGKMNDAVLGGMLEEAILYGPISKP